MKAIIKLDVPKFQIGESVTVYFRDSMQQRGICEIDTNAIENKEVSVIHCRDCIYKEKIEGTDNIIYCPHIKIRTTIDWFCGDGKIK